VLCLAKGRETAISGVGLECWPLIDGEGNTLQDLEKALWLLDSLLQSIDAKVLVHCNAGRSRSPMLVIAWLARAEGIALDEARGRVGKRLHEGGRGMNIADGLCDLLERWDSCR
jgi:protein-tyrosine phosphatase